MKHSWFLATVGFLFGCLLFTFAMVSAGAGHGSYLPFLIFGAPLSLIPFLGLFVAPVCWSILGYLIESGRSRPARIFLSIHIVTVIAILFLGSPEEPGMAQWDCFWRTADSIGPLLWGGFAVYLLGQLAAWNAVLRRDSRRATR